MKHINRFFCAHCFAQSQAISSLIEHDGSVGVCRGCGERFVQHECASILPPPQSPWLPILKAGVSEACPVCGTVITIGEVVAQEPAFPEWLRELGQAAAVVALIIGGGVLIGKVLNDLSS